MTVEELKLQQVPYALSVCVCRHGDEMKRQSQRMRTQSRSVEAARPSPTHTPAVIANQWAKPRDSDLNGAVAVVIAVREIVAALKIVAAREGI